MDEVEQQSKQIRYNAEQLENLCSDRMSQLYQEKRKSRKQYQEEHAKIVSQFAHVSLTRTTSDLPNPTRCINKFSEKSSKFFGNSMELQLISQEWERKLHLFSWTWWTDILEPRDFSYEHEKNEKKSRRWRRGFNLHLLSSNTCSKLVFWSFILKEEDDRECFVFSGIFWDSSFIRRIDSRHGS